MNILFWNGIICLALALFGELRLRLIIRTNNLKRINEKKGLHSVVEWLRLAIFCFIPIVGNMMVLMITFMSDEDIISNMKKQNMVEE